MEMNEIRKYLFDNQDLKYRDFQANLTPDLKKESFIGVRTPVLRAYAKELVKERKAQEFISALPHDYFEENQLHAYIISLEKSFYKCIAEVESFLPFVDNWATCDQLRPKCFSKNKEALLPYIYKWIESEKTYIVRFGVGMLMCHFLDKDFNEKYLKTVSEIRSEEYYINMMVAWYFATALAKQYEKTLPFIENRALDKWTHNKAIQKAVESYRITDEQKAYLKTLKRRD
ncbi:MAG: DNA alkylation repair protein [Eubacterium sp.]|nr:DNA alkylation repair protein [Eubacterium sp.]